MSTGFVRSIYSQILVYWIYESRVWELLQKRKERETKRVNDIIYDLLVLESIFFLGYREHKK